MTEVIDRTVESAEQDQTARMCKLILLCTLHRINLRFGRIRFKSVSTTILITLLPRKQTMNDHFMTETITLQCIHISCNELRTIDTLCVKGKPLLPDFRSVNA